QTAGRGGEQDRSAAGARAAGQFCLPHEEERPSRLPDFRCHGGRGSRAARRGRGAIALRQAAGAGFRTKPGHGPERRGARTLMGGGSRYQLVPDRPPADQLLLTVRKERIEQILALRTRTLTVVLDRLEDTFNMAAVLRTCEGMGIQEVHVVVNPE